MNGVHAWQESGLVALLDISFCKRIFEDARSLQILELAHTPDGAEVPYATPRGKVRPVQVPYFSRLVLEIFLPPFGPHRSSINVLDVRPIPIFPGNRHATNQPFGLPRGVGLCIVLVEKNLSDPRIRLKNA
eukprot:scaffold818_cov388-Pavlova_lutheri.AAC.4